MCSEQPLQLLDRGIDGEDRSTGVEDEEAPRRMRNRSAPTDASGRPARRASARGSGPARAPAAAPRCRLIRAPRRRSPALAPGSACRGGPSPSTAFGRDRTMKPTDRARRSTRLRSGLKSAASAPRSRGHRSRPPSSRRPSGSRRSAGRRRLRASAPRAGARRRRRCCELPE